MREASDARDAVRCGTAARGRFDETDFLAVDFTEGFDARFDADADAALTCERDSWADWDLFDAFTEGRPDDFDDDMRLASSKEMTLPEGAI